MKYCNLLIIQSFRIFVLSVFCIMGVIEISAQENPEWWEDIENMPDAKAVAGIAELDGKIYIAGGAFDVLSSAFATMDVYDPETGDWNVLANMNYVRAGMTLSAVNGKLYAIGGDMSVYGFNRTKVVEEYDPETNLWTLKSSMPEARCYHTATVFEDKIYIIGGNNDEDGMGWPGECYVYDPALDEWNSISSMILPRNALTSVVYDNRIFVFGGYTLTTINIGTIKVESYDPKSDEWQLEDDIYRTSVFGTAVNYRDTIYIVGGNGGDADISFQELARYKPWYLYDSLPTSTAWGQHILLGDYLYYFGGFQLPQDSNPVFPDDLFATNEMARIDMRKLRTKSNETGLSSNIQRNPVSIYPNPAVNQCTIDYTLDSESDVVIGIYNLLGEPIEQWVRKRQSPGNHSFELNTENIQAGMYLCHFILENNQYSITMIIKAASH